MSVCYICETKNSYTFFNNLSTERRGVSQDVTLDIKIGIEAKNYEGVSNHSISLIPVLVKVK